jgi:hypothetical protein
MSSKLLISAKSIYIGEPILQKGFSDNFFNSFAKVYLSVGYISPFVK